MIVYRQISCICLHANEGRESKTKDPCIMRISIFGAFSAGKKCALYTGKYGSPFFRYTTIAMSSILQG